MSERTKRQKEAERLRKSLESGLIKKQQKRGRQSSGRTGRTKGDKNVKSLGDNQFINQYGVEFSASEREALRQAVNSVKRKKKRILSEPTGKYEGLKSYLMSHDGSLTGILGDFTTSMNKYETREALENELARLKRMSKRGYELELMKRTKENYIENLKPTFEKDDPDFLEYLKNMPETEFFNRRGSNLTNDFLYINSKARRTDDVYIVDLVHSFGWLSVEEQLNRDEGIDSYTGDKVSVKSMKQKARQQKRGKTKKSKK